MPSVSNEAGDAVAQENLVQQGHEFVLHVAFELGDELDVLVKEGLKEQFGDVPSVSKELAPESFNEFRHGYSVIHIAGGEAAGQQFTFIIDDQVQLEAIEPVHTGLATHGPLFKDPMRSNAPIVADCQGSGIEKGNAGTLPHA